MNERGFYEIVLEDRRIELRFCTWSLKRFCELNGDLSFQKLLELFSEGLSLSHVVSLILCAAEYNFVKRKEPFPFTDIDASDWIDELGGINGAAFLKVMQTAGNSLSDNGAKESKKKGK